jgi:hypothetical protein
MIKRELLERFRRAVHVLIGAREAAIRLIRAQPLTEAERMAKIASLDADLMSAIRGLDEMTAAGELVGEDEDVPFEFPTDETSFLYQIRHLLEDDDNPAKG